MINNEKQYELIKFEDEEFSLDVNVSPSENAVWLNKNKYHYFLILVTEECSITAANGKK